LTSPERLVQRGELQMPHAMSQTSRDIISGILNWVCPECCGRMGGRTKEFKCQGECRTDWRNVWKRRLGKPGKKANDAISALWCIARHARGGYRPNPGCANRPYPFLHWRPGIDRNAIFVFAAKSRVGRIPGFNPNANQSHPELMDRERPTTEPLINELRTMSAELGVAIQQSHRNEGTAQRLAARQARLLKQLMSANSRVQRRTNDVLDPQQRKKLDSFKRTSQVTVVDGN